MKEETFETMLLRLAVSSLFSSVALQVAREMFSKSYFELGQGEKIAVDQAAFGLVAGNFQAMTEETLRKQFLAAVPVNPVGFAPPVSPKQS